MCKAFKKVAAASTKECIIILFENLSKNAFQNWFKKTSPFEEPVPLSIVIWNLKNEYWLNFYRQT